MPVVKMFRGRDGWWNFELKWDSETTIKYSATTIAAGLRGMGAAVYIQQAKDKDKECE